MSYIVYQIKNLKNNKRYIGSTIQEVQKRWNQHKITAFNPKSKHYNYPLYCSFRKYGLQNFKFSILQEYSSKEEMEKGQRDYIIKYLTLNKNFGYNQTIQTECALRDPIVKKQLMEKISQKCAKVDENENIIETYSSYQEAARLNNMINSANHIRLVCKGEQHSINGKLFFRDLDKNGNIISINNKNKNYKNKKSLVGIPLSNPELLVYYQSVSQAARVFNTGRDQIQQCIKGNPRYSTVKGYLIRQIDENNNIIENNIKIADKIKEYQDKYPEINGERHTITQWCKKYNITPITVKNRLKKYNITLLQALTAKRADLSSFSLRR